MARFRQVHTSFWQDAFVLDLTPEEKYFYLYLMTNPKTSASGVYELPMRVIELETGYNRDTVEKLLQKFINRGKIRYSRDTSEILLVNWLKYNNIQSKSTQKCIETERSQIKDEDFREYISQVLVGGIEGAYTPPTHPRGEKEKEKDTDKEKDIKTHVCSSGTHECDSQELIHNDYPPDFEQFWLAYHPDRRRDKQAAFTKWKARIRAGATPEQLITAVHNYIAGHKGDPQFLKLPKTFLNADWKEHLKPRGDPQKNYTFQHRDEDLTQATQNKTVDLTKKYTHQHPVTDLQKVVQRKTMIGIGGEDP